MIFDDITEFAAALPPRSGVAGLDFGEKTIGVAVSDTYRSVATPLETIRRTKFTADAEALLAIVRKRGLGGKKLKPAKSARARIAASSASGVVRPQSFMAGAGIQPP